MPRIVAASGLVAARLWETPRGSGAAVVEVQLRIDRRKRRTWPVYVATVHARLHCPVALLVICPDRAAAAMTSIDLERANLYTDLVLAVLPAAARARLEEFMTTTGHRFYSELFRRNFRLGEAEGEARGEARGEAKALLAILETRAIEVPDEFRVRILDCTDLDQLGTWIRRAVTADKIEDLGL